MRRWLLVGLMLAIAPVARAQQEADLIDRPISEVRVEGLERVSEQLVRNQLRAAVGDPYDPEVVRVDVERNLLLVKGAVPGAPSGRVIVSPASKVKRAD